MKIVHVLPSLARGGGERLTIELANRQVDAGHEVSLVVGSFLPEHLTHDGLDPRVTTHFITSDLGRRRYRAMLPWLWRKRQWLSSVDILHCHLSYGAVFGSAYRRIAGRKRPAIVETYHAVGMPILRAIAWLHERLAWHRDGLAMMVENVRWQDFAAHRREMVFRIIPIGVEPPPLVDQARANAFRAEVGIPDDALVVTTIGRLVAERRARSYVPVFAEVTKALGRNVHFVMGGDGPERAAIEADAEAAGIRGQLHLLGTVLQVELPLAVSDLYVTANVGPVSGVAGLQAIAAGVPTLAIQLSPDRAENETDWIWSSGDPGRLAEGAVRLLRDKDAAGKLADRQKAYLQAYHSAAEMTSAYEDFYRETLARLRSD